MTVLFIIVLAVAIGLGVALYFQMKASHGQAAEQQQLLSDYQRRVDEQQKLLDDYRALEKNFDSVGEGYEQALLAFDKMEEDSQKAKAVNEALEKRCSALQTELNTLKESAQKREEILKPLMQQMEEAAKSNPQLAQFMAKLGDMDDMQADLPPIDRTDNVLVQQIAEEAIRMSGIDKAGYLKLELDVAPDAAATMLSTNLKKAVRALTHLLDNAQKFTSDGSVKLSVAVDMDKMQAIYTVQDTGAGVEAADAERIFEPYVKLNQFFDGQGIGLTVARNLVRRLGGDIRLDTESTEQGARFILELPI